MRSQLSRSRRTTCDLPEPDVHHLEHPVAPYALGALDGEERRRFEAHLAGCNRCSAELPELQHAAAALALDVDGPSPPVRLRERIVAAAQGNRPPSVTRPRRWFHPATAGIAAAAACAAIGLGIWGVSLSNDLDRERLAVSIVADPTAARYPLVGARGHVVVARSRNAALVVSNLRRAPTGKTYELWVVVASKPKAAGLFRGGGLMSMVTLTEKVPHGAQVAVSLEPTGGSSRPSGSLLFAAETT